MATAFNKSSSVEEIKKKFKKKEGGEEDINLWYLDSDSWSFSPREEFRKSEWLQVYPWTQRTCSKINMPVFLTSSCDPGEYIPKMFVRRQWEVCLLEAMAPGTLERDVGKQLLCMAWSQANFLSFTRSYNQSKVAPRPHWLIWNPDTSPNY